MAKRVFSATECFDMGEMPGFSCLLYDCEAGFGAPLFFLHTKATITARRFGVITMGSMVRVWDWRPFVNSSSATLFLLHLYLT